MGRFVFDTNVLVSALLFKNSIPGRAFRSALDRGSILISSATVIELSDVLSRPKFDKYVVAEEREAFVRALVQTAELVDVTTSLTASRDPKDNKFLELAVSGKASHIISGDEDLLILNPFLGIAILTSSEFLKTLEDPTGTTPANATPPPSPPAS